MRQRCRLIRRREERRQIVLEEGSLGLGEADLGLGEADLGLEEVDLGEDSPALGEDRWVDLEVGSHLGSVRK